MLPFFQEIPGSTDVSELVGQSLLLTTESHGAMLVTVGPWGEYGYPLTHAKVPRLHAQQITSVRGGRIANAGNTLMGTIAEVTVVPIPPVKWSGRGEPRPFRLAVTLVSALGVAALLLGLGGVIGAALALPAAGVVALAAWNLMRKRLPARILTAGNLELDGTNIVEYAAARQLGERPELLTDVQRRETVLGRIEEVRQDYVDLRTDVGYRIENSALFDPLVPATSAFEVALARYDAQADDLGLDELDELATDVEITYSVARDHAETIGMAHLPVTARADARRAAKAYRLAEGASNDAEREAAMGQVVRILDSLALYYLPAPEGFRQITDGTSGED